MGRAGLDPLRQTNVEILRDHKVATISIGGKRAMFLPSLLARLLKVYTLITMKMKTNSQGGLWGDLDNIGFNVGRVWSDL